MKEKIKLSETHRRVLSVVLKLVERGLDEMWETLNYPHSGTTYGILTDLESHEISRNNRGISRAKELVKELFKKYNLRQDFHSQCAIINAKKANLWSILEDTYSKKLGRYGEFDRNHAAEFDSEIKRLIDLIESI
jgi:predicted secreted Zn-dependent protease